MFSAVDSENGGVAHGYTRDNDNTLWYWTYDGESVRFREHGYPSDHPIRRRGIPDEVREHAETHVGASIERARDPRY